MRSLIIAAFAFSLNAPAASKIVAPREGEFRTLDPMQHNDIESSLIISQLYSSLLTFDYLKSPRELIPDLLEKMPEKKEGNSYVFTLKKGVLFNDDACFPGGKGRALSSSDVVYSLKRYADAKVNDASFDVLEGLIKGIDDFHAVSKSAAFSYDTNEIAGVRVLDSHRFIIDFSINSPLNLQRLAFVYVVPKEAVEHYGSEFARNPVGTGAYSLQNLSRRGIMTLASRKAFHRGPVQIDTVEMPLMEEAQPRLLKFLAGQIDYMRADLDTYSAHLEKVNDAYRFKDEALRKKFKVESAVSEATIFLRFSFKDPLISRNRKLRQAIAMAINGRAFADTIYKGTGNPGDSIVSPALRGSSRDTRSRWYEYDARKARQLLADAGLLKGNEHPEIKIAFGSASQNSRRIFEFIRNELAAVGIRATPVYYQTYGALAQDLESGNFQVASLSWTPYYPDAEGMYSLFSSKSAANYGAYLNPDFDRLYTKSKNMANGPERYQIFAAMDQILKDDVAFALPIYKTDLFIGQNRLKNFRTRLFDLMELH